MERETENSPGEEKLKSPRKRVREEAGGGMRVERAKGAKGRGETYNVKKLAEKPLRADVSERHNELPVEVTTNR